MNKTKNNKKTANGGEFLGCWRTNGKVFIWQDGIKFLVKEAELVV